MHTHLDFCPAERPAECWSDPLFWCCRKRRFKITHYRSIFTKTSFEHGTGSQNVSLLVVPLPELDGTDIRGDEDGTAQEGVEGCGEDCRHYSLDKQHGRVWRGSGQGSLEKNMYTLLCLASAVRMQSHTFNTLKMLSQ